MLAVRHYRQCVSRTWSLHVTSGSHPAPATYRTRFPAQPLTRWWPNHPYRSFPWKSSHWSICDDSCTSKLRGGRRGRRSSMAPSFDQDARKQAGQDSLLFHDDSLRSVSPPRSRILDPTTTPPSWILERRLGGIASWNSQQQLQKDLATLEAGSLGDFSPAKRSFPIDIWVSTPRGTFDYNVLNYSIANSYCMYPMLSLFTLMLEALFRPPK